MNENYSSDGGSNEIQHFCVEPVTIEESGRLVTHGARNLKRGPIILHATRVQTENTIFYRREKRESSAEKEEREEERDRERIAIKGNSKFDDLNESIDRSRDFERYILFEISKFDKNCIN